MREVIVPKPQNESLTAQLVSLYQALKGVAPSEVLRFDLSSLNWVCPLLMLPLSAYINTTGSTYTINPENPIVSYLDTIHFPKGVGSTSSLERFFRVRKSYLPIGVLRREKGVEREQFQSLFEQMVYTILQAAEGTRSAVYYPIGEIVGNIFDHSKKDEGFITGQYYPKKDYLDICIVDCGRGLTAAYHEEKGLTLSDEQAIAEVMKGHSTKMSKERGFGVRTSKRVVCEGLNGGFILLSGNAALISVRNEEKLVTLPNFYWQGVMVAYRIPRPKEAVTITSLLE